MAINVTRWSICLLVLLSILPSVFGLYFYLEGSEQKCFTEELPKETMVIGNRPLDLSRGQRGEEVTTASNSNTAITIRT
jgi:hypothetical protein